HYRLRTQGRAGITKPAQIEALIPYLDHLNEHAIYSFWDACNRLGWYDLRREYFDSRLDKKYGRRYFSDDCIVAMFDNMVQSNQIHWMDRQIEDIVATGVTAEHLKEVVETWLQARATFDALRFATQVIIQIGTRKDLSILNVSVAP